MRMMPCGDSFSLVSGSGQIMNDGSILVAAVFGFHQPKVIVAMDPAWAATALPWVVMDQAWAWEAMLVPTTRIPMRYPTTMAGWAPEPALGIRTTTPDSVPEDTHPATTRATMATAWSAVDWAPWAECRPSDLATTTAPASRAPSTRRS